MNICYSITPHWDIFCFQKTIPILYLYYIFKNNNLWITSSDVFVSGNQIHKSGPKFVISEYTRIVHRLLIDTIDRE